MRIACVGGGPAGLYFALSMKLRDPGHDITVFERNTADSAQGWGVTFGRDLLTELYRSDPESAQEIVRAAFPQKLALESYERQRKAALLRPQSDARFSARWFENMSRYVDLPPHKFSALLHGRRSPLLPHLPPHLYYGLHRATEKVPVLGELRRRVGPKVKAIYSQRKPVRPGNRPAIRENVNRWN